MIMNIIKKKESYRNQERQALYSLIMPSSLATSRRDSVRRERKKREEIVGNYRTFRLLLVQLRLFLKNAFEFRNIHQEMYSLVLFYDIDKNKNVKSYLLLTESVMLDLVFLCCRVGAGEVE